MAHHLLGQQAPQFVFGNARRHHREPDRLDPRFRQSRKEAEVGIAVDRVHDTISRSLANLLDNGSEVAASQRHILFAHRLEPLGLQVFLGDEVGRPRIDIVGADQEDPLLLATGGAGEPVEKRQDLLVGHHAAIHAVGRRLIALVLHRIEQQPLVFLEERQHALAAGARPAAKHRRRPLVEHLPRFHEPQFGSRPRVGRDQFHLPAEDAASRIDPLEGMRLDVAERSAAHGGRTGLRVEEAHGHRFLPGGYAAGAAHKHRRSQQPGGGQRGCHPLPQGGAAAEPRGVDTGGDHGPSSLPALPGGWGLPQSSFIRA